MDKIDPIKSTISKEKEFQLKNSSETIQKESKNSSLEWCLLEGRDFKFTNAVAIKIKDREIPVKNWRYVLIEVAKYCKQLNPQLFQSYCVEIENESILLFFRDYRHYWKTERHSFHPLEENIYLYTHGDCNTMCKQVRKMSEAFGIPFSEIKVKLENKRVN